MTTDWWTFHGDAARSGCVAGSNLTTANVANLKTLHTLQVGGPVMSVPAFANGFIYVGVANFTGSKQDGADGGAFHKIDPAQGTIAATYTWPTERNEGDTHGFTGMGCTPAVVDGRVYFSAFDGKLYCLDADTLSEVWVVDLRQEDLAHNQPITNTAGVKAGLPQAEGWSSPLVVGNRVYVGLGEGENPHLWAFIYCLDAATGNVIWIFCTCKYTEDADNQPNVLPKSVIKGELPPGFTTYDGDPVVKGCCVWSALSYDSVTDCVYANTGNPQPEDDNDDGPPVLPAKGYAYGMLKLDASTGALEGYYQVESDSSYRDSDIDIDFGTSPAIFTREGRQVAAIMCKNGGLFVVDLETMTLQTWRNTLPYYYENDPDKKAQIPTVDPHGPDDPSNPNPVLTNEDSNATKAENFYGGYSTPAINPALQQIFVGSGGNNYHYVAAGIDYETTPFMRALNWSDLSDAWPMEGDKLRKYTLPVPPMYTTAGEAGLSSPVVVNDVVFMSTSKIAIYAFDVKDGTCLWSDVLGAQTGGFNGGYGYCLGPAVCGDYVVAGGLVYGRDGGVLKIYGLGS